MLIAKTYLLLRRIQEDPALHATAYYLLVHSVLILECISRKFVNKKKRRRSIPAPQYDFLNYSYVAVSKIVKNRFITQSKKNQIFFYSKQFYASSEIVGNENNTINNTLLPQKPKSAKENPGRRETTKQSQRDLI